MSKPEMTALYALVHNLISQSGPISLGQFMSLCLGHPQYGYYMSRQPFGTDGDFTTAPEISQLFGEMIAVWVMTTWEQMGRPSPVRLIELGPGRGTLMKDIYRSLKVKPELQNAVDLRLVEFSPLMRGMQEETLTGLPVTWHETLDDVPEGVPSIIIANEFFDALPIEQAVFHQGLWYQRMIAVDDEDLIMTLGAPLQGIHTEEVPDGSLYEYAPSCAAYMADIAARIQRDTGAAVIIDYGDDVPLDGRIGDTLQILYKHQSLGLFDRVGESDVTAHVAFAALSGVAAEQGCTVSPLITQREFLTQMGIRLRAESLMASGNDAQIKTLKESLHRLIDAREMGDLFKVLTIHSAAQSAA